MSSLPGQRERVLESHYDPNNAELVVIYEFTREAPPSPLEIVAALEVERQKQRPKIPLIPHKPLGARNNS